MSSAPKKIGYTNLVFEGGGAKGIAFVGAMRAYNQLFDLSKLQRVAGSSAGAMMALLLGLRYTVEEIDTIMNNLDLTSFMDAPSLVGRAEGLWGRHSLYKFKGDALLEWAKQCVAKKLGQPDATFEDAKRAKCRDMFFTVTNLSRRVTEILSTEHTPNAPLAVAVRTSMSFPGAFCPMYFSISDKGVFTNDPHGDVYIDGGVLSNYPIRLFDRYRYLSEGEQKKILESVKRSPTNLVVQERVRTELSETSPNSFHINPDSFGFRLDSPQEIKRFDLGQRPPPQPSDGLLDFSKAFIDLLTNAQEQFYAENRDQPRTISINTLGVGTLEFDMSLQKKQDLVKSGEQSVRQRGHLKSSL